MNVKATVEHFATNTIAVGAWRIGVAVAIPILLLGLQRGCTTWEKIADSSASTAFSVNEINKQIGNMDKRLENVEQAAGKIDVLDSRLTTVESQQRDLNRVLTVPRSAIIPNQDVR